MQQEKFKFHSYGVIRAITYIAKINPTLIELIYWKKGNKRIIVNNKFLNNYENKF